MITRLTDRWIGRHAEPQLAALRAVDGLRPMTVVTGGSRGIGFALARRFAKAGRHIALVARDKPTLDRATAEIASDYPVKVLPIALDVTAIDAAERLDAELRTAGYYLETLVNNAGIGLSGPFIDHAPDEIDRLISLNITALTRLTRHALPAMLARGYGGILNVASLGGLIPGPNQAAYYASKAYVVSLTRAIAAENAGRGVRLMALAPGPVDTGFHHAMGAELSYYRQLMVALSARQVAFEAYIAYRLGTHLYVPGILGKLMQVAVWIIPHALLLPLMGWLLQRREERPWHDTDHHNT